MNVTLKGILPNATPLVVTVPPTAPYTAVLNSENAGRKIEISVDGGILFFTPIYDPSHANQLVVIIRASITHVKFTGVANDAWRINS